jgi:uncharacterized membrane protein
MNGAHLHLVVNHFPIIGSIFGLGILIAGILMKNNTVKNTSYFVFIVAAIFSAISMYTGEGAEHTVKDFPEIGRKIIHEHEEMAEKLAFVLYLLGLISIAGIYSNIKNHTKANLISYLALTVALVGVFLGKETGTTGGEVRHTEIRENYKPSAVSNSINSKEQTQEDED